MADAAILYKPSWVDRLIDWIDRLPVPAWVFYGAVYLLAAAVLHGAVWLDGVVPVGRVSGEWMANAVWSVVSLAWIHYLEGAARRSLDNFSPVVTTNSTEYAALRHRMLEMPARPVLVMTTVAAVVIVVAVFSDPAFAYEGLAHPLSYALAVPVMAFAYGLTPVVLYFTVRLLGSVTRAYNLVEEVNVLHQRPLFAFSNLTMQSGLLWLLIVNYSFASIAFIESGTTGAPQTRAIDLSFAALGIGVAFVSFLFPLRGIHRRLVDEKSRLIEENAAAVNGARIKLYAALDRENHPEVESFDRGLSSLFRLRDELQAIPTWPWRPGTFRTFLSAVVLPILVWVAQQLLTRYV